jgi:DNA-binding response OmpR family regulator
MPATLPRTDTRRVLIIEDHADSRDSLRVLLTIHGCEVRVAADALDGVRQAIDWRPDVVISDINLPGLDGWQLARQVRAGLGEGVFLVAVSGMGRLDDQRRSIEAGFNAHLAKPTDLNELLGLLRMAA